MTIRDTLQRLSMLHFVVREIAVFLFFVAAAVLMTWPLAAHLDSAISDPGDPYVSMAIIDWDLYATLHHPTRLFHQPLFYPTPYTLAFTEHLYGIALPVLPFYLAGVPLVALYNISLLLGFALCGYGSYVVGRLITGSFAAAVVGGLFFAFVPYRITQIPHISYVWAGWLPLLLAALLLYDQKPGRKHAALFGLVFFMNGLTTMHWLAMGSFAVFVSTLFLWIVRRHDRAYLIRLGIAAAVAITLLLPFLLPYRAAREMYGMRRSAEETEFYSARWGDWLIPDLYLPYGRLLNDESIDGERWLFPGFVPLLLAAAGLLLFRSERRELPRSSLLAPRSSLLRGLDVLIVITAVWSILEIGAKTSLSNQIASRFLLRVGGSSLAPMLFLILILCRLAIRVPGLENRSLLDSLRRSRFSPYVWVALLGLVLGVIGSLGLHNFFYSFLFDYVRAFRSIRVPARWAMIAYVGLAALVSCGVAALISRTRRRAALVPIAAAALLIVELSPAPRRWYLVNSAIPPVYRWIAQTPLRGPILELPVAQNHSEYGYMHYAPVHRKPMVGGVSSFIPPQFVQLGAMAHQDPIPEELMKRLEEIRCSLIIVHADWLGPHDRTTREWLTRQIRSGRLSFVRRFAHDERGDYVFAMTKTEPEAIFWREPEQPDRSGRTPLDNLQTFLQWHGRTFFDTTLAGLEPLSPSSEALGELQIAGWALSPKGVREVNLRFHSGELIIPAELHARPEISASFPWYPETPLAGFRKRFDNRPRWAREQEDLQVEIIDGAGRPHLLDPVFFSWRDRDDFRLRDWDRNALHELIYRIYRRRDSAEVRRARKTGLTMDEMAYSILRRNRRKDDRAFIDKCHYVLFNRPADVAETNLYLKILRSGKSRRDIVRTLIRSPEFRRIYFGR